MSGFRSAKVSLADNADIEKILKWLQLLLGTEKLGPFVLSILDDIHQAWSWTGLIAEEIVRRNSFGNILLRDRDNRYWRICPEELSCEIVAQNSSEYAGLLADEDFLFDWEMSSIVEIAQQNVGQLEYDWVYYLVIPAVLGGEYNETNIRALPLNELIHLSGTWACEIAGLPDGAKVYLRLVE